MRASIAIAASILAVASAKTISVTDTVDVTITSCEPTVSNCPYKPTATGTWDDWNSVTTTTTTTKKADPVKSTSTVWADWESTKRSYELMARYVHPHFQRQSNTLRVASYDNATAKHATAGAESQKAVESEIERYEKAKAKA